MKHLKENNETYLQHLRKGMYFSCCLLVGCCCSIIHSFIPCILKQSTTNTIQHIQSLMILKSNTNLVRKLREQEDNEGL